VVAHALPPSIWLGACQATISVDNIPASSLIEGSDIGLDQHPLSLRPGSMSGLPRSAALTTQGDGAAAGSVHSTSSASSPTNVKSGSSRTRKRTLDGAGVVASPESENDGAEGFDEKRRQPGVKRACNECRQQKVSGRALRNAPTAPQANTDRPTAALRRSPRASLCALPSLPAFKPWMQD